ncbi:hypothetical protein TNCV_3303751 [Trichonephila clavipes]|nr:hypothetical protein TNCV_3303751 [Trichonephila clavipes]
MLILRLVAAFASQSTKVRYLSLTWRLSCSEFNIAFLFWTMNPDIYLRWIQSHVIIRGSEIVDRLTKEGSEDGTATGTSLTYQELYSNARS